MSVEKVLEFLELESMLSFLRRQESSAFNGLLNSNLDSRLHGNDRLVTLSTGTNTTLLSRFVMLLLLASLRGTK